MYGQTFSVGFEMTIGHEGGKVLICANSNGHELEEITEVLTFDGCNILPYLEWKSHQDIYDHYERHSEQINASQQGEYD